MKAVVVFDSYFGNTEKVAQTIGAALAAGATVEMVRVGDFTPDQLAGVDLVVVGSPTRGFNATEKTQAWLKGMAPGSLRGVRVAAFDTRMTPEEVKSGVYTFLVRFTGYAAEKIERQLTQLGGAAAAPPGAFIVLGQEGPLKEGELARVTSWAQGMLEAVA